LCYILSVETKKFGNLLVKQVFFFFSLRRPNPSRLCKLLDCMNKQIAQNDDTFLALDIGGTNINCGLVTRSGEILFTDSLSTKSGSTPQSLIDLMVDKLKVLWKKAENHSRPKALAIGAPGWLKPREGVVVVAPNIPGWRDIPITRIMSQALDLPARLENDANIYALGEWLAGAGRGADNQITITLGTGVGGGLILNGKLWVGSFASAAEIGHIPLGPSATITCGCGRQGCLETVASARGMTNLAKKWLETGRESTYLGSPEAINTETMKSLAIKGDPMSIWVFQQAGKALGQILSGIFNLLSLQRAVIGGGAAGAFEFIQKSIIEVLGTHLVTAQIDEIQVVKGQLGASAPLVGAAALLAEEGF
jgi:glucokinase